MKTSIRLPATPSVIRPSRKTPFTTGPPASRRTPALTAPHRHIPSFTLSPILSCRAVQRADSDSSFSELSIDKDLWEALELCNSQELEFLYDTLFSPSLFSPFIKSLVAEREPAAIHYHGRTSIMHKIQSRFRFLAASSLETLKGYRPTYRETLLHMKTRFDVRCPKHLDTADLETEIYLHLLSNCQQFLSEQPKKTDIVNMFHSGDGMAAAAEQGMGRWRRWLAPLQLGKDELLSLASKIGGVVTLSVVRRSVLEELGMQVLIRRVQYQNAIRVAYLHGLNTLKKRVSIEVSHGAVTKAIARYSTVNGTLSLLAPLLWTWLAVDVVMKSIGTDYARITKTVFSLAQIRLIRTYGFTKPKESK